MNIEDISPDDLIGLVKYKSEWQFFAGTVAEWIMDYKNYDPWFDPSQSDVVFRNNILVVNDDNAAAFVEAMQAYRLSAEDITTLIERDGVNDWPLVILIDFDKREYINGFGEIPLHQYIPAGWTGFEGDPLAYVPENMRSIWQTKT